ncbi:MAG TPA: pilus assembly protein PilM [Candidatus Paceibacterota bacterium]
MKPALFGEFFGGGVSLSRVFDEWFPTPLFLQPSAVGVDISDASVKWVALESQKHPVRVHSFGEMPIAPGVVVAGVIKDQSVLVTVLQTLRQGGITEAHAALPEEAAYVFTISVPEDSTREQILHLIEFEFEGRVPIVPEASVYDFEDIPGTKKNGVREIGVVVFPRELAEAYVRAFESAGIRLLSLELEARSIARAVIARGVSVDSIVLLVDFGRSRSGIAVLKNGIPIFTATTEIGGDLATHELMGALSVSESEAEEIRNERGLLTDPKKDSKVLEITTRVASALSAEVTRYFTFWDTRKNETGERVTPVSHMILVGGSSNLKGLEDYIAHRVNAPVSRADVWQNVFSYDDYIPPIQRRASLGFATAIGLSLRGIHA